MGLLFLTGFMGTGKSATAGVLAEKLSRELMDLDQVIEVDQGRTISDIFAVEKEPYFRKIESETLRCIDPRTDAVVSCGGGIVLDPLNVEYMRNNSELLVCLDARPEVIYNRIKKETHRPLLAMADPLKIIHELMDKRADAYASVAYHVDTSDLTPDEVARKIIKHLKGS